MIGGILWCGIALGSSLHPIVDVDQFLHTRVLIHPLVIKLDHGLAPCTVFL